MEKCGYCVSNALYICTPCRASFCDNHKTIHEEQNKPTSDPSYQKCVIESKSASSLPLCRFIKVSHQLFNDFSSTDLVNLRQLNSMNPVEAKNLLESHFSLFLEGHAGFVKAVAITRDEKYIISGPEFNLLQDYTIRIWKIEDKRQDGVLVGHTDGITCIVITGDDRHIISGSRDKTVRVWNFQSKSLESIIQGHRASANSISLTSDNKYIFFCSCEKPQSILFNFYGRTKYVFHVWNLQKKKKESSIEGKSFVSCLVITNDNHYIVTGSGQSDILDFSIKIWVIKKKKCESILYGHSDSIQAIAITRDDKYIISGSNDYTVRIWNFRDKRQEGVLEADASVYSISVTVDSKLFISGCSDGTVKVWNLETKRVVADLKAHSAVNTVAVTNDNKYIVTGTDNSAVTIWDIKEKRIEDVLEGHSDRITAIAATRDYEYIVSGSCDRTVRIWKLKEKRQVCVLYGHNEAVLSIAITKNNKFIVSGSDDQTARVWRLKEYI